MGAKHQGQHQKRNILFISVALFLGLGGCSSVHESPIVDDSNANLKRQILELQKIQTQQSSQIEDLNNKISMLSKTPQPATKIVAPTPTLQAPPPQTDNIRALAPILAPPDRERRIPSKDPAFTLFRQIVADCKKPRLDDAAKSVALILKKFKDSPVTSNAIYLYADTLFERDNYAKSADEFEKLYKLYPDGNKAVSALYKLALCYQRLGHPAEAQQAFENIVTLYPGSREALDSEKQIMNGGQENSQ
jgi:TolA-binding protein